jgi:hypothetical protein
MRSLVGVLTCKTCPEPFQRLLGAGHHCLLEM